jgi:hypothetical protein
MYLYTRAAMMPTRAILNYDYLLNTSIRECREVIIKCEYHKHQQKVWDAKKTN